MICITNLYLLASLIGINLTSVDLIAIGVFVLCDIGLIRLLFKK